MVWVIALVTSSILIWGITKWLLGKRTVRNYEHRYVLITGCNSGFGNQLAKRLDELGFNVFAGCHSDNGVRELHASTSERLLTFKLDVANPQSIRDAVEFVKSSIPSGYGLWGLVNNAGIAGTLGPVDWLTREHYLQTLTVNVLGLIDVTTSFLPLLRQGQGRVINMSSILTTLGVGPSPYIVSKCAMEGFSECLRLELRHQGVGVSVIQPGFYKTNLLPLDAMVTGYKSTYSQASEELQSYYGHEYLEKAVNHCHQMYELSSETFSEVTDAGVHALTSRTARARYIVGHKAWFIRYVLTSLPRFLRENILTRNSLRPVGKIIHHKCNGVHLKVS